MSPVVIVLLHTPTADLTLTLQKNRREGEYAAALSGFVPVLVLSQMHIPQCRVRCRYLLSGRLKEGREINVFLLPLASPFLYFPCQLKHDRGSFIFSKVTSCLREWTVLRRESRRVRGFVIETCVRRPRPEFDIR